MKNKHGTSCTAECIKWGPENSGKVLLDQYIIKFNKEYKCVHITRDALHGSQQQEIFIQQK